MDIAILTPIRVEHNAILSQLSQVAEKLVGGQRYLAGKFEGKHHSLNIITQQTGSRNEVIALAAEKVIRHFQPMVVLLAGVAGGVKDVAVGDVVVGTKYYGFESGKVTADGFAARPESGHYSQELITAAQSVSGKDQWWRRAKKAVRYKAVFGAISAGNKVIAATDSEAYRLLKRNYNDTTAIEMEAAGFGQAMLSYPAVRFMNIRGISDLLDGKSKSDAGGSQELAADNMAAFVFELLYQLDVSKFKIIGSMDIKELAKEIIGLIVPVVKLDIENGRGEGIDNSIKKLWAKAKPLISAEYEDLKNSPNDVDAQADARSALRRALKKEESLRKEMAGLVERVKKEKRGANVTIKNSKNVVQGSTVSVGGDFRLGDG